MSHGFVVEHDPAHESVRRRRAESLEQHLTAVRIWVLRVTRLDRVLQARPLLRRTRRAEPASELQVARLDAGRRERMLWLVHDTARAAQLDWQRGDDPSEAMHDLALALARIAEYDV